eukprot:CAMPEP_0194279406 /NCGR_PEP_ID=MMETSP0169-20130528/13909_1 /TAXON_ID=218684 /ORGANISM="Corethron pennatum, Strain L29A3" /LENGTH=503 /DNA_ID=CAMNT_0039023823 /DNA_START=114 /DNA_END=1625 /DNA_ORIENTATION=+
MPSSALSRCPTPSFVCPPYRKRSAVNWTPVSSSTDHIRYGAHASADVATDVWFRPLPDPPTLAPLDRATSYAINAASLLLALSVHRGALTSTVRKFASLALLSLRVVGYSAALRAAGRWAAGTLRRVRGVSDHSKSQGGKFTLEELASPEGDVFLPSPSFSRVGYYSDEAFSVRPPVGTPSLAVHYLQTSKGAGPPQTIVHCSHGFGASALSWVPVFEGLASAGASAGGGGAATAIAHDSPGFGLTERPCAGPRGVLSKLLSERRWKGTDSGGNEVIMPDFVGGGADIGTSLVNGTLPSDGGHVILIGHSMGTITALRTTRSLLLAGKPVNHVVLVAPAIINVKSSKFAAWVVRNVLSWPLQGALRLGFRSKSKWKRALTGVVWADGTKVADVDVDRYFYPTVASGWERGIVHFLSSQISGAGRDGEDAYPALLREVRDKLGDGRISIIHGEADAVIPVTISKNIVEEISGIDIFIMEGIGHCPMEEDPAGFLEIIRKIFAKI